MFPSVTLTTGRAWSYTTSWGLFLGPFAQGSHPRFSGPFCLIKASRGRDGRAPGVCNGGIHNPEVNLENFSIFCDFTTFFCTSVPPHHDFLASPVTLVHYFDTLCHILTIIRSSIWARSFLGLYPAPQCYNIYHYFKAAGTFHLPCYNHHFPTVLHCSHLFWSCLAVKYYQMTSCSQVYISTYSFGYLFRFHFG